MSLRKSYFISDLHLTEDRPDITSAFTAFLSTHMTSQVDALYILGDFFEVWIGDDGQTTLSQEIASQLKALKERGIKVYFTHGNRDFLVGEKYAQQAGFTLLSEQTVINLYGTPTVILHGDEMCTQDIAYQKFRKKSRGWWWPKLMLAMPLWYRKKVAAEARAKSIASQKGKPLDILDVTEDAVLGMFEQHKVANMIHGHTHRPNVHTMNKNDLTLTRTVLGDWYSQSSYLVVTKEAQTLHAGVPFKN